MNNYKSKGTATALAFFLGGLGIHHFYLGNTRLGVLYLVFCWTFIPMAISLLETIIMMFRSTQSFDNEYNHAWNNFHYKEIKTCACGKCKK